MWQKSISPITAGDSTDLLVSNDGKEEWPYAYNWFMLKSAGVGDGVTRKKSKLS